MEEEHCDELAEDRETNKGVIGVEGLDEDEVLGGGDSKLGGDLVDDRLGAPTRVDQYICQRVTKNLQQ